MPGAPRVTAAAPRRENKGMRQVRLADAEERRRHKRFRTKLGNEGENEERRHRE